MSFRTLAIVTLFLSSIVRAATVTLYDAGLDGMLNADSSATQIPSIVASAVDVLPGNITEYFIGQVATISTQVGSGTATSLSPVITASGVTVQEGANFVGYTINVIETLTISDNDLSTTTTTTVTVTGRKGCTMTAPPTASETVLQCAEVHVLNNSPTTLFYNATASPFHTLTESTPPPTASVTTGILFPSGVPNSTDDDDSDTSAGSHSTSYSRILLIAALCLGLLAF